MMNEGGGLRMIFLDTSYFAGLMNHKDPNHQNSLNIKRYIEDINEPTVINTTVLVETLNRSVKTNILANNMYQTIKASNQIIELTNNDYMSALEVSLWFGNSINYSDCTIIHTMFNMRIRDIVSFDSDFNKVEGLNVISAV